MKKIYLIGIKGVGMTALAIYLKQCGYYILGSDIAETFPTDSLLLENDIKVINGFSAENINLLEKDDLVVVSAAYDEKNPEFKEAKKKHLEVIYFSEAVGKFSADKKVIIVSGVHGKTTTTAMIATLLDNANYSPSYLIGSGLVPGLATSAKKGGGDYFVIEADEYRKSPGSSDAKFFDYNPQIAVVTSIELDHPDMYESIDDIYNAFYKLVCRVPRNGLIVACSDYPKIKKLKNSLVDRKFETYGFANGAIWQIVDYNETENTFFVKHEGEKIGPIKLKIFGKHNALNATAAIIVANFVGLEMETIKKAISNFSSVQRRFQIISDKNNIAVIDDYAHHPTAISTTLDTVRAKFPKSKIWVIFQPHTFSRTQALLKEFGQSFKHADNVLIMDIYGSAREEAGKISSLDLVEEIKKNRDNVRFIENEDQLLEILNEQVKAPAVIITLGAGNIYKVGQKIKELFKID